MLRRTSVLGIIIAATVLVFGNLLLSACTSKKGATDPATPEATLESVTQKAIEDDTLDNDSETLVVDEEFLITIEENQDVGGF